MLSPPDAHPIYQAQSGLYLERAIDRQHRRASRLYQRLQPDREDQTGREIPDPRRRVENPRREPARTRRALPVKSATEQRSPRAPICRRAPKRGGIFARFRREIHARYPFVSSEVETPLRGARPHGISPSLDANGEEGSAAFFRSEERRVGDGSVSTGS